MLFSHNPVVPFSTEDLATALSAGRFRFSNLVPDGGIFFIPEDEGVIDEGTALSMDHTLYELARGKTVVLNEADSVIPAFAAVAHAATEVLQMPFRTNAYLTGPGVAASGLGLHTDTQSSFIVQLFGAKRWRVFAPPVPFLDPKKHPFDRGKFGDVLAPAEVGELLVDVLLVPGKILWIPAGYPHNTDTMNTMNTTALDRTAVAGTGAAVTTAHHMAHYAQRVAFSAHATVSTNLHADFFDFHGLLWLALARRGLSLKDLESRLPGATHHDHCWKYAS